MRWIHGQVDRASQRMTFTYRIIPRLSLGVEYNPKVGEFGPLMNLVAVQETKFRPAVLFGISSDRIGTPDGRAYFATVSKNLEDQLRWPVSPYIGVAYGTYEDELDAIGGVHVGLWAGFSSTLLFDGKEVHPTLAYRFRDRHVVTLLWVATKDLGLSYSVAF